MIQLVDEQYMLDREAAEIKLLLNSVHQHIDFIYRAIPLDQQKLIFGKLLKHLARVVDDEWDSKCSKKNK